MSKKPITLNYEQARELKFFCRDVAGVRMDMYEILEKTNKFDDRIKRLENTCTLIEKYLGEPIEPFVSPWVKKESILCESCQEVVCDDDCDMQKK